MGKKKSSLPLVNTSSDGTKKRKLGGAGARRKGLCFEREIATALGVIFPDAQRELEYQASGNSGTDIEDTDLFQFQCKRWASYCPISTIDEIKVKSDEHIPVLVTQGNRMECMAVLPFSKLVTLIEIAYGLAPRMVHPSIKASDASSPRLPQRASPVRLIEDAVEASFVSLDSLCSLLPPIPHVEEAKRELLKQSLFLSFL